MRQNSTDGGDGEELIDTRTYWPLHWPPLSTGHWLLPQANGDCPLATGHWPLAAGYWPLATGY